MVRKTPRESHPQHLERGTQSLAHIYTLLLEHILAVFTFQSSGVPLALDPFPFLWWVSESCEQQQTRKIRRTPCRNVTAGLRKGAHVSPWFPVGPVGDTACSSSPAGPRRPPPASLGLVRTVSAPGLGAEGFSPPCDDFWQKQKRFVTGIP